MAEYVVNKLAVIGVGLIGGSLALALREAGAVAQVSGVDVSESNLEVALARGIVDSASSDPAEGVRDADMVVLATPVRAMRGALEAALPGLASDAVITDVGSVKEDVIAQIEPLVPQTAALVPGHPVAGTEKGGAAAAFSSLFRGRFCVLTPTPRTPEHALDRVRALWRAAGSQVVEMEASRHDRIMAVVSHLPHMVAYTMVNTVEERERLAGRLLEFSAGGFRDFTRVASSDPVMWRDIALSNREALLDAMTCFETLWKTLKEHIASGDEKALEDFFIRARALRARLPQVK